MRDFRFESTGVKTLVFYPIDQNEYKTKISVQSAKYNRFENSDDYCKSRSDATGAPEWSFRHLTGFNMDAVENADLSKDFNQKGKLQKPL